MSTDLSTVKYALSNLSDKELAILSMAADLGGDLRRTSTWPKVEHLFTEREANRVPVVHAKVRNLIIDEAERRLG